MSGLLLRVPQRAAEAGHQRLSGFLPLQSAYADFYRIDTLWPDMTLDEMMDAMRWYQDQDVTLGG